MQRLKDLVLLHMPAAKNEAASISFIRKSFDKSTLIEPGRYFPATFHKRARTELNHEYVFKWSITHGPLDITLRFVTNTLDEKKAKDIVHDAAWAIRVLASIKRPPSEFKRLEITLLDIDAPKRVRWADIPDATNVNTGFTWGDKIYVYRREEMCKVLIHELVHFWRFELARVASKEQAARQIFGVDDLNFNEGYVDSIAVLLHTLLVCAKTGSVFDKVWKRECEHIMYQALCVSINYLAISTSTGAIKEKTNTMSYYVVKAALYCGGDRYWSLLAAADYDLSKSVKYATAFYNILIYEVTDTRSTFWKRLRDVHKHRGVCQDGDTMRMTISDV